MRPRSAWAVVAGVGLTILVWVALREYDRLHKLAGSSFMFGYRTRALLLATVLGVGVGVVVLIHKLHPLVPGVPALSLAVVLIPLMFGSGLGFVPTALRRFVFEAARGTATPAQYVVMGVLGSVAVWRFAAVLRDRRVASVLDDDLPELQ